MKQRGMTLIELMVVMVIVAILGAIAIPSYRNYVIRVTRTDAKAALTSAASLMERCYTRGNTYVGCLATPPVVPSGKYVLSVDVTAPNAYLLSAAPQGAQADDTECATLTLNQLGEQRVTGPKAWTECW